MQIKEIQKPNGIDLGAGEEAKTAVRKQAETPNGWQYQEMATQLYGWTDRFRDRFLDPIARVDRQGRLPGPVIGFEPLGVRTLAYYRLGRNALGLEDEIILNSQYLDRPLYTILETVLHEDLHLWQQRFGDYPIRRNYHNAEFVAKAESLGLHPFPIVGFHWKPADGPFEALLYEYGVYRPEEVTEVDEGERRNYWETDTKKGKSTLSAWECPSCHLKVRVGVRRDIRILCGECDGELFVRRD